MQFLGKNPQNIVTKITQMPLLCRIPNFGWWCPDHVSSANPNILGSQKSQRISSTQWSKLLEHVTCSWNTTDHLFEHPGSSTLNNLVGTHGFVVIFLKNTFAFKRCCNMVFVPWIFAIAGRVFGFSRTWLMLQMP